MSFREELQRPHGQRRIHDMIGSQDMTAEGRSDILDIRAVEAEIDRVWPSLVERLNRVRDRPIGFYEMANFLYILKPEMKGIFNLNDNAWYTSNFDRWTWLEKTGNASLTKMFSSAHSVGDFAAMQEFFSDKVRKRMTKSLAFNHERKTWFGYLLQAERMYTIDPAWAGSLIEVDSIWSEILEEARKYQHDMRSIVVAKNIKIISPQRIQPILDQIKKNWKWLMDDLRTSIQQKDWPRVAETASSLKIIAAKEVNITDDGIELVMPGDKTSHKETVTKRPIRQNF